VVVGTSLRKCSLQKACPCRSVIASSTNMASKRALISSKSGRYANYKEKGEEKVEEKKGAHEEQRTAREEEKGGGGGIPFLGCRASSPP
jgi:hypothetical protein